jgi:hypothetical protein
MSAAPGRRNHRTAFLEESIMKRTLRIAAVCGAFLTAAAPLSAQAPPADPAGGGSTATQEEQTAKGTYEGRPITMQHFRPLDQRGINMFETPKEPGVEYTGFKIDIGGAFASQVQNLHHENTAVPVMVSGVNSNQLQDIGFGFNTPTANLYLHAQLADGIRVQMTADR